MAGGGVTKAETINKANTRATIGNDAKISGLTFKLLADHETDYNSQVDTLSVSLVGGGGSLAKNRVDTDVSILVGDNTEIQAFDITLAAKNSTLKDWLANDQYNVGAGAGAAVGASVAKSESIINQKSKIDIGAASLKLIGDILLPGSLSLDAKNITIGRDRVSLDTAAAINLALAESILEANTKAIINMGLGSNLVSVGDINISALTMTDMEARTNIKTSGLAPAALGTSIAQANVENSINIEGNLYSENKINLLLGQDKADNLNSISLVALTNIDNRGAAPLYTDPDVNGILNLNNFITLGSNALLESVSDTNLLIERGTTIVSGRGQGTDWIKSALGAEINILKSTLNVNPLITINGTIRVGINCVQEITIVEVDGDLVINVNGTELRVNKDDKGNIVNLIDKNGNVVEWVDGISILVEKEVLATYIMDELNKARKLAIEYAGTEAGDAFKAQAEFLEEELRLLGYDTTGNKPLPPVWIDIINIGPIKAEQGNINILAEGGSLIGTGKLIASDKTPKIEIINESPAYLRLGGLIIPEGEGGRIIFNYGQVLGTTPGEINTVINSRNLDKRANFSQAKTLSNEETRSIRVENTSNGIGGRAPDIQIFGPVENIGSPTRPGLVWIEGRGSISTYSTLDAY